MNTHANPSIAKPDKLTNTHPLHWTTERVQNFWNYQSQFPEKYFTSQYGAQIAATVRRYLPKEASVLDFACGTGALTGHLLDAGFTVTSCDLSENSVRFVQETYRRHSGFSGAFTVDGLAAAGLRFDAVVLVELIEHADDTTLMQIFDNVRSVLSPGGVVVVTTPNAEDLSVDTVYCPCCNHTFHRWQHVRSWSSQSLSAKFSSFGLKNVATLSVDFCLTPNVGYLRYVVRRLFGLVANRRLPHLVGIARK